MTEMLYHYTDVNGLRGILENNTLWATHYKYLNDISEISISQNVLMPKIERVMRSLLEPILSDVSSAQREARLKNMTNEQLIDHEKNALRDSLYARLNSFHVSFSSHTSEDVQNNGLLSQWRSYGQYSLVFNQGKLKSLLDRQSESIYGIKKISPMIYSDESAKINTKTRYFEDLLRPYIESVYNNTRETTFDLNSFTSNFIDLALSLKHHSFKEENECRISIHPADIHQPYFNAKFRSRNGCLIPYFELFGWPESTKNMHLNERAAASANDTLPIIKIIVGPNKDKEILADSLKAYLQSIGRAEIEVVVSEIPYV